MIRLLMVDDDPEVIDIGNNFLEQSDDIIIDTAKSAIEALQKLEATSYDAIISDYEIPEMGGIAFLKKVRASDPDIPFIILAGKGHEEIVIEALKNGADHCIQKREDTESLLIELSYYIQQGVERRRSERTHRESEELYYNFIQNFNGIAFSSTMEFIPIFMHGMVEEISGYSEDEFVAETPRWDQLIHPDDLPGISESIEKIRTIPGYSIEREYRIFRKDGEIRWVHEAIQNVCDSSGKPVQVNGVAYDVTDRVIADKRVEHLNRVLLAIRNVNQLIIREKDPKKLAKEACKMLVETRGYNSVWIALLDESGKLVTAAETGLGEYFLPLVEQMKNGQFPECAKKAIDFPGIVITEDHLSTCENCPIKPTRCDIGSMTLRLVHEGNRYGYITITMPKEFVTNEEEQALFEEVAGDIAFALYSLKLEDQHKLVVEELKQQRNFAKLVMNNLGQGLVVTGKDWCFEYVNPALGHLLGISQEELTGGNLQNFIHPEDQPILEQARSRRLEGEKTSYEIRLKRSNGETVYAHITGVPRWHEGQVVGTIGVITDITEIFRAQEQIKNSERRLADIIDFLPEATFVIDKDGCVIAWNKAIERMTGVSKGDIMGEGDNAYTVPFYGVKRPILIDLVFSSDEELESQYDYIKKEGKTIFGEAFTPSLYGGKGAHIWGAASPLFDGEGNIVGAIESIRDISKVKQVEEELRQSEETYRTIFETTGTTMVIIEEDSTISLANTEAKKLFGYSPSEVERKSKWTEFVAEDDLEKMKEYHRLRRIDPGSAPRNYEFRFVDTYRDVKYACITIAMIPGTKKSIASLIDITDLKHAEDELRKHQDQLEQMVEERTTELEAKNAEMERFVYAISHDLMTPLVTISGFLSFLKKDIKSGNTEGIEADIRTISDVTVEMSDLLNDTLELSRIGRVVSPPEDVPFDDIVQEALNQSAEMVRSRGVEVSVSDDMPVVHVDRKRLVEVLVNLIENSIKYMGEEARPKIDLGYRKDGSETVFFVCDNGIGIDPSQHEKVFELFYQLDNSSKGTGAGLTIVKRIIDVHGGHMWIESEAGRGCTVCFTLPLCSQ